jgi:aminoglycoside 3'-phosphotransferase-3
MYLPKEIEKYLQNMNCIKDNEGMSKAGVYKLFDSNNTYYLKVQESCSESRREQDMYQWLKGKVPVPRVICQHYENGLDYLLLEEAKGVMLESECYRNNPEQLVKLAAEGLKLFWSIPVSQCPYEASIESKLKIAKEEIDNGMKVCVEKNKYTEGFNNEKEVYEYLVSNIPKEDKVLTHGDYCFNNYFAENNNISGFIDMGRGGIADRYQDIALCVRELMVYEEKYTELLFQYLNIKPDFEKIRYYILLDELF